MKWNSDTEYMTDKAHKRLWMFRRLSLLGASRHDRVDDNVYPKHIRPVLDFSVPVWHPSLTETEMEDIECAQKSCTKIIFKENFKYYNKSLNLKAQRARRIDIHLKRLWTLNLIDGSNQKINFTRDMVKINTINYLACILNNFLT